MYFQYNSKTRQPSYETGLRLFLLSSPPQQTMAKKRYKDDYCDNAEVDKTEAK